MANLGNSLAAVKDPEARRVLLRLDERVQKVEGNLASILRDNNIVLSHTELTDIGTKTHAQIDTHIADSTLHFTEASIDHGSIDGLSDDDHTQYLLIDGTRAMTGNLDLGTVGRLDSNVADAAGVSNFLLQPTTTLTSGSDRYIARVNNQGGTGLFYIGADGSLGVGATPDADVFATFAHTSSSRSRGIDFVLTSSDSGATIGTNFTSAVVGGSFSALASSGITATSIIGGVFNAQGTTISGLQTLDRVVGGFFVADGTTGKNAQNDWVGGWEVQAVDTGQSITTSFGGIINTHSKGTNWFGTIYYAQSGGTINDDIRILSTGRIAFGEAAPSTATTEFINSAADGHLDLNADTSIDMNANVDISAKNVITDTTTGTQIATAASQKLGFFGATPVVQAAKASYNNWAAFTDVVDALVALGLFDTA